MWLIFEGLDKSGKTTLEWAFLKATNYKHIVIDRGPVGYLTFDRIFHRSTKDGNNQFEHQINQVNNASDVFVIYCKADWYVVKNRLRNHNETCDYDYCKAQELLDHNIDIYYDRYLVLDTGQLDISECVEYICQFVGVENECDSRSS